MSVEEVLNRYKEVRQRLRKPPNAVPDHGIDLTRKSTAYKGDVLPEGTPPKKKLVPETIHPPLKFPIKFDDILGAVSEFYGIGRDRLMSPERTKLPVLARRVIIHLALKMLQKRSVSSIARELDQDHTTVLHARNKINSILICDENLLSEINIIEEKILASYRLRFAVSSERECGVAEQPGEGPQEPGIQGMDCPGVWPLAGAEGRPGDKIDQGLLFPQDHPEPS